MLHSKQDSWPAFQSAEGLSETAEGSGGPLTALAREIEETQRQQSDALQHIVKRLRALALTPSSATAARPPQDTDADPAEANAPRPNEEPWDTASAEALMQAFEADLAAEAASAPAASAGAEDASQTWLGQPLHDVTQRIKRTLADLKPGAAITLLEERLDQFQHHINLALEDVVRRADLEGLRRIEEHVSDLGEQLHHLEHHVRRFDGLEADVRSVMEQVSDERLAKLLDSTASASDLEAVAMRAAEETQTRLAQHGEEASARRHQELAALIEASLQDRRQADTATSALAEDLSGQVAAQADRYNEIKALLEETRSEQRLREQTALGMLDTLQQALVRVLDRMDVLEQRHGAPAPNFSPASDQAQPPAPPPAYSSQSPFAEVEHNLSTQAPAIEEAAAGMPDEMEPAEVPAAFVTPGEDMAQAEDGSQSAMERLRQEFIADARRAKLKAAANRAEALSGRSQPSPTWEEEPAPAGRERHPAASGASRLFGSSPKLLAGVLALVVAINGGLLLLSRKDDVPPVPEITVPGADATEHGAMEPNAASPGIERSLADDASTDFAGHGSEPQRPGLSADHRVTPYGDLDDVLNPPQLDPTRDEAAAPPGTTIVSSPATHHEEAVAGIYEQQVLAGLSGQLGTIAAARTPDAMLPEMTGRIIGPNASAHLDPMSLAAANANDAGTLDLPPATVGPLSLRLAAAKGDASAQFEVGARLAEGKGTAQDFAEAARWYQRSAAKGFAQSQYRLGTLYERGLGVGKDLARARVWYARAAEQGNVKAMHNLAVLVAGGEDIEPDYAAALTWFSKAAEHGLADSQFNLGVLYENGLGIASDRVAAYKWYALAAEAGDQDAGGLRDALKSQMSPEERSKAESLVKAFKPRAHIRLANDALAAGEDWKQRAGGDTNT